MDRTANPHWKPSKAHSVSPWLVALEAELNGGSGKIAEAAVPGGRLGVVQATDTLWGWLAWGGGGLALRLAYAPGGLTVRERPEEGPWGVYVLDGPGAEHRVELAQPDADAPLIRWRITLTPKVDLVWPFWPRDLAPLDGKGSPLGTRGLIHATQRGPKAGLLYASLVKPKAGSFLYLQDFTSLNDYCEAAEASPFDTVGGDWPELGFALPPSAKHPLPAGKPVVISDAILQFTPDLPKDHAEAARIFIDLFADAYLHMQRSDTSYHDWLGRAKDTLHDLETNEDCTTMRRGLRYFNAYVGTGDRPPESMVQLAVLLPILDYLERRRGAFALADEIKANLGSFYNPSVGTLVRWLPGEKFEDGDEEDHKDHHTMDAWYLYHTLLNAGRLALKGDEEARRLLLASLPFAEKVARRYSYRWPIMYDLRTLEPIRATSDKGFGETDVAGLYALVMLQAYDLTGNKHYHKEAETAAKTMARYGFQLAYQFNSTIYGCVALARLWRATKDTFYRDLSLVGIANFLHNIWLWQCRYGHGKAYPTFMGLPPLHDAPYIAIYEEEESLEAFASYLEIGGDDLPESVRMLLPEYAKYVLDRSWCAYPSELPAKVLAKEPKEGHIDRKLAIPLEDLGDGRYPPGKVGQEIYGSGAAPLFAAWAYHDVGRGGFLVFSEYIAYGFKDSGDAKSGSVRFRVRGDPRLAAKVRLIPQGRRALPKVRVTVQGRREPVSVKRTGRDREFIVPGGSTVTVEWGRKAEGRERR